MLIKGRSSHIRHVYRTHRVNLDWFFFERDNLNSNNTVTNGQTNQQIADILTKGSFTRDTWNELMSLFGIVSESFHWSPFSVVAALVPLVLMERESAC